MPTIFQLAAGAFFLVLPALGETVPPPPSIAIFMDFDSQPGQDSVEVMKREVNGLLKPSGITLDWRLVRDNHGTEAFGGIVLVKFTGSCRAEAWPESANDSPAGAARQTLGWTRVMNGHTLPFSEVECNPIRKALAYLGPETDRIRRQKALGLALGRVVAHELYHIFARTTEHADQGLAKASESLLDLAGNRGIAFQPSDSQAMRDYVSSGR